jgi:hypothetical protein
MFLLRKKKSATTPGPRNRVMIYRDNPISSRKHLNVTSASMGRLYKVMGKAVKAGIVTRSSHKGKLLDQRNYTQK